MRKRRGNPGAKCVGWSRRALLGCTKEKGNNNPTHGLLTEQANVDTFRHCSEKRDVILKFTLHPSLAGSALYYRSVCLSYCCNNKILKTEYFISTEM